MLSWQVVNVSGNANNSVNTGAFNVNANNDSGNANQNISRQLRLWFKFVLQCNDLASWQNTKQDPFGAGKIQLKAPGRNKQTGI